MSAVAGAESRTDQKAWFLRALLVLQSPRPVFAAIRDDSDEVAEARQDAAGAIVWLGGIAGILATTVAGRLLDDVEIDGSLVAVWAFLAGGLYGFGLYYIVGKVLHVSLRRLGGRGSFRRARHLLAFAATPVALALFVYWPIRIAIYGGDLFRTGGADGRGAVRRSPGSSTPSSPGRSSCSSSASGPCTAGAGAGRSRAWRSPPRSRPA